MKKATTTGSNKRQRGCSEALSDIEKQKTCEEATSAPLLDDGASPSSSLDMPADFDATRRRRSLTLPPSASGLGARAASASPMMASQQQQRQSNPKRRRCVTVELRKQLAAKSSLLATPPFPAAVPPSQSDAFAATPMLDRAQSMGLSESFSYPDCSQSLSQDYGAIGYYGSLSLASSLANDGSPQLLDMNSSVHSNSPYIDDMGPMAPLPISQTFSMPDAVTHNESSGLSVDTSFVSVSDVANSAFDL
ncbi:hypothetical protein H4R20_007232, partial [Coemansia guatemalensis]